MLGQKDWNVNGDMEIANSPADTVSSLEWSPAANFLAGSSWNGQVSVWEVADNGQSVHKLGYDNKAPVLCTAWSSDGSKVFLGGCDKQAKVWDLAANTQTQVAAHDEPVKECKWISDLNSLATASWDKTVKFWDLRAQQPQGALAMPGKVFAMDIAGPLMVVGTSDRKVTVYDLRNLGQPYKPAFESPLKMQTRTIACFPTAMGAGFAIGSIEGRVAIHYVEDAQQQGCFAFKCHRHANNNKQMEVFSINSIKFHQQFGTFVTAGSDGQVNFWDKDSKQRLKQYNRLANPITACGFNATGAIFAYAMGYDWSKGLEGYNSTKNIPVKVYLHGCSEEDVKPRPKQ